MSDYENVREFDCVACGRHIIRFCAPDDTPLCAPCLTLPGWFRDPAIRASIDPDHDGQPAGRKEPQ